MGTVIVLDTSVFIAALLGPGGASRDVLRRCLAGRYIPLMGTALFREYESVLGRADILAGCRLSPGEREAILDAFLRGCCWQRIYFAWRPNLPDEADNHLVELAVAGGAQAIVTRNVRDFRRSELRFPDLRIVRPEDIIEEERSPWQP